MVPKIRSLVLQNMAKDLRKGETEEVFLCFTCDPYQDAKFVPGITRAAIRLLSDNNVRSRILTKGGMKACRDFDLFSRSKNNILFGVSLTLADEEDRKNWEPGAAPSEERIASLGEAKKAGIETWVSLEPVIDPEQTLELVNMSYKYVDIFKIGKLNHVKNDIDWVKYARDVISLMKKYNKRYYVKEDLRRLL